MEAVNMKQFESNQTEIFSFEDEKTKEISFENLSNSIRQEGKYGDTLKTKPVQIWTLGKKIMKLMESNSVNYSEDPIYVQKKSSNALLRDADKQAGYKRHYAPIEKWKFDKVIMSYNIPKISNVYGTNARIGITLNDLGVNVAFGMNVVVCSNFSVMGGTIMRTYKTHRNSAMDWDLMKYKLEKWVGNLDQIFNLQTKIMHNMKSKELKDPEIITDTIGDLYTKAIRSAYFKGEPTPMDTHELSKFTQEMLRQKKEEEKISSVWDLYNWGTSIMKPGITDIGNISENSEMFSDYLCQRFDIENAQILANE